MGMMERVKQCFSLDFENLSWVDVHEPANKRTEVRDSMKLEGKCLARRPRPQPIPQVTGGCVHRLVLRSSNGRGLCKALLIEGRGLALESDRERPCVRRLL